MARIEGIRIKNYRVLKNITLGKLWNTPDYPTVDAHDRGDWQEWRGQELPISMPLAFCRIV